MNRVAVLVVVGLAQVAGAGSNHVPTHSCSDTYYGDYKPHVPTAIEDVLPSARRRLMAHLSAQLGAEIAAKTTLIGGQIVDRQALLREHPNSANYQWHVPKYNIKFRVPLNGEGVCASMKMDEDGTLIEGMALPDFKIRPERRVVITAAAATELAREKGVPEDARRELLYFKDSDSLEWIFTFTTSSEGVEIRLSSLHIPAHDTKQVHWTESIAIR